MSGAQGVEDLGGVQSLFGVVEAVEERRNVEVDGRDGAGMAVGVDGLGLPEIILGDPESVAFRAVGRRCGAGGHLGAAVFAQSVVAQALGDRADGDAQVAVAQQGSVREFARGHEHGRCVKDSGVPGYLTEGFGGHVWSPFFCEDSVWADDEASQQQPSLNENRERGAHDVDGTAG